MLTTFIKHTNAQPFGVKAAAIVIALWLLAIVIGWLFVEDANLIHLDKILHAPNLHDWLGNDDLGRSLAARILAGAQISLVVSITVVSLSLSIGMLIGLTSAYIGGALDAVLLIIMDIVLAFPGLLLAIALAGLMGPGLENVVIALSLVSWVSFARLTRAQALTVKTRDHVSGDSDGLKRLAHCVAPCFAFLFGATHRRGQFRHSQRHCRGSWVVVFGTGCTGAASFLGQYYP